MLKRVLNLCGAGRACCCRGTGVPQLFSCCPSSWPGERAKSCRTLGLLVVVK